MKIVASSISFISTFLVNPNYAVLDKSTSIVYLLNYISNTKIYENNKYFQLIYIKKEFDIKKKDKEFILNILKDFNVTIHMVPSLSKIINKYNLIDDKDKIIQEFSIVLAKYNKLKNIYEFIMKKINNDLLTYKEKKELDNYIELCLEKELKELLSNATTIEEIDYIKNELYDEDELKKKYLQEYKVNSFIKQVKKTPLLREENGQNILNYFVKYIKYDTNKSFFTKNKHTIINDIICNNKVIVEIDDNKISNAKRIYTYIYNSVKFLNIYNSNENLKIKEIKEIDDDEEIIMKLTEIKEKKKKEWKDSLNIKIDFAL